MAYENQSLWLGCVAALCPSEDTAGNGTTTLTDFTGVSNGVLTGMDAATDWVTDDGKLCLDFDGSNDHVVTGNTPVGGAKCLGLAAKFRRLATTGVGFYAGLSNVNNSLANRLIFYHFTDGNFYIQFAGVVFGSFALSLTDTTWKSLVINYDGTQTGNANRLKAWINGVQQTLTFGSTVPASLAISDARLWLGVISDSAPLYGRSRIDDVRVNVRTFTDAERAILDSGRGAAYTESAGGSPSSFNPFRSRVFT